jgi:hypothetical protein
VGEALLYEAILTVAQLTSLHSLLPTALQHIRHHSLRFVSFISYTQLMFWIQYLVFERPKFHTLCCGSCFFGYTAEKARIISKTRCFIRRKYQQENGADVK